MQDPGQETTRLWDLRLEGYSLLFLRQIGRLWGPREATARHINTGGFDSIAYRPWKK